MLPLLFAAHLAFVPPSAPQAQAIAAAQRFCERRAYERIRPWLAPLWARSAALDSANMFEQYCINRRLAPIRRRRAW
jgi:hypothetical protein